MKRWVMWGLLLLSPLALAIDPLPFRDAAEEERFRQLTAELRCVMCQNQSLADSNAMIAQDLRREVLDLMHAGKSNEEIKAFLVERYTDFVLYNPPVRSDTLMLWLGPGVVLLAGLVAVTVIIRRRAAALGSKLPPVDDSQEW
ncbi:cytochrome c-type biogenesis protein [Pseudomarimonas salicorniae]|uniref:Cytochrome c-type biogenesis protein n=1 Tax=Pseudomarimonas salicorniae TaxID=2933270 RepID=A0ABT0GKX3_9GAMM|nr:cytochrome c-type biogenesis protein [Lysobacter sp. CAU 1642]MCK7595194.1 cytochrome c-type biogenesis protein CcmH [Lysobacter sp. CAU 1642]